MIIIKVIVFVLVFIWCQILNGLYVILYIFFNLRMLVKELVVYLFYYYMMKNFWVFV